MSNLRLAIVVVALMLVLLSLTPLRRGLPVVRHLPRGVDFVLWIAFVGLCLGAFASVRTVQSTRLSLAAASAGMNITDQAAGSVVGPAAHWVSAHQAPVAALTLGFAGLVWILAALRLVALARRAARPRRRLGGGWVVVDRRHPSARRERTLSEPAAAAAMLMEVPSASTHVGVSHAAVYRQARVGRLNSRRSRSRLHVTSGEANALRGKLLSRDERDV